MSKIWIIFLVIGLVSSFFLNTTSDVINSINTFGNDTLNVFLKLSFLMLLWNGLFNILKDANVIKYLTKVFKKPCKMLFKNIDSDSECFELIVTNIIANMIGLGSCATVVGIKVVNELDKLNKKDELIKFILINISTLCLFPSTIVGIRLSYNSTFQMNHLFILVSLFSFFVTLLINKIIKEKEV
jgi:spore maturation protein A